MKDKVNILIVEDKFLEADLLKHDLEKMGYKNISIAISYNKAMKYIKSKKPDIILLDIDLNSKSTGLDLAYEYEVFNKIPIIYVTGETKDDIINKMLESKKSDYLSKPIKLEELKFKLYQLFSLKNDIIDIGHGFTYQFNNQYLMNNQELIQLSVKQKKLLQILIEAEGRTVSYEELESQLWDKIPRENSLRDLIYQLKNKKKLIMIENIPRYGYKLPLKKDSL